MESTLLLSHLPRSIIHPKVREELRRQSTPPVFNQLTETLRAQGVLLPALDELVDLTRERAARTEETCRSLGIGIAGFWSDDYPPGLRVLDNPPWCLYYLGKLPEPALTLAVVGSRRPNSYGEEVLARILPMLRTRPLQLVSGLAYGVDALAHFHSCETSIPNFAVLGCGVDICYPPDHDQLLIRIIESQGGILSEYPPGTLPAAYLFPHRNRIISALADVVWVVQGAAKSGSLHTAKHALDQAKAVCTTPGDIFSELSQLPHRLLSEGAHPITSTEDLDFLLGNLRYRSSELFSPSALRRG